MKDGIFLFLSFAATVFSHARTINTHANRIHYILCAHTSTRTQTHNLNLFILFVYMFRLCRSFVISSYVLSGTVWLFVYLMDIDACVIPPAPPPPSLSKFRLLCGVRFNVPVVQFRVHFDFVMNAILTVSVHFIVKILFVKFHIILNLMMLLLLLLWMLMMLAVHSQSIYNIIKLASVYFCFELWNNIRWNKNLTRIWYDGVPLNENKNTEHWTRKKVIGIKMKKSKNLEKLSTQNVFCTAIPWCTCTCVQ